MKYCNIPVTEAYINDLKRYSQERLNPNFLKWKNNHASSASIIDLINKIDIISDDPSKNNILKDKVVKAINKFPQEIINELIAICGSSKVSIVFNSQNDLDYEEYERKIQSTLFINETGWARFTPPEVIDNNGKLDCIPLFKLKILNQWVNSDDDTFSGLLFHEFCHLIMQMTKEDLFNVLGDNDFREDECVYVGALLMLDETISFINFMKKINLTRPENTDRDYELIQLAR